MDKYPIFKPSEKPLQAYELKRDMSLKSGLIESYFCNYFCSELELLTMRRLQLPTFNYKPDAIFINKQLFLDIEVDEPYSLSNNDPIHYMGYDDKRDKNLNDNGISVLRFAEYQVKNFPNECLQIIKNVINNRHYLKGINVDSRFFVDRWTREKAIEFANEEKRDYYDFTTEKIIESQPQILKTFLNYKKLLEYVEINIREDYDPISDFVIIPYEISDLKIDELSKDKMIICTCDSQFRGGPLIIGKMRFHLSKNKNIFDSLFEIKASSKKIKIETPEYFGHYLYGLVLWGNVYNFNNNKLKYKIIG